MNNVFRLRVYKEIGILIMILVLLAPVVSAQQQEESTVIYEANFFAQYNPATLTDMIRSIPGGETVLSSRFGSAGVNNRGFGANDSQVLLTFSLSCKAR